MAHKLFVFCLVVICVTVIAFTWITRGSLCELRYKQGGMEMVASLACQSTR